MKIVLVLGAIVALTLGLCSACAPIEKLCGEPQDELRVPPRRRWGWGRQWRLTKPRLACQPSKKKPRGIPGLS